MDTREAKPFSELYPDKIVSMLRIGPEDAPTILLATEHNVFQIIAGTLQLVKFVERS